MPPVDFIFDFASPNAYLTHKVLPQICERTGATFNYIPCLLGGIFKATGNQAPMIAFAKITNRLEYERQEFGRFISRHGLSDFKFNPHFPVNTLLLMRGAIAIQDEGPDAFHRYVEAVMHHMWEEPRDLNDPVVVAAALNESGFDAKALLTKTQAPEVKAKLAANTNAAVERGAFGIPTFFVGKEMFFGKERLSQVTEEIINQS